MPTFTVLCADRSTGRAYQFLVNASGSTDAVAKAQMEGHIVSGARPVLVQEDPPAHARSRPPRPASVSTSVASGILKAALVIALLALAVYVLTAGLGDLKKFNPTSQNRYTP